MDESQGEKSELKQIRTFQGDVAEALGRQNESLVSIQRQETAKRPPESSAESELDKKKKDFLFLLVGSAFLIIVGSLGAWFGYKEYQRRIAPPVVTVPTSRFITASKETTLGIATMTREEFALAFAEVARDVPAGAILHVAVAPEITTSQFLNILEVRAPGALVRSFDKLFMIGVIGGNPFLIVKLVSFENAFAGMLSWESTMPQDLLPLFPQNEGLKAITTTSVFKDIVVRNKDVRALPGGASSTTPVLLYTFFDNKMLIITDSIEALETLMDRLTRERLSR
ncbi:MAG: hypothetical protein A3J09_02375 [Candidatus Zambryskibacteria bacterium RIFCSPLOWO2_02_FULL_51_21]|uniref:Uncharacterized protein n=1 Tax=Candidatus Zambryskibacteria bacterium RIFCSPHIGHO2_02_FULL_43_37 TaxID=1802749 RepID=A0A1G2TGE2_9BACT|nr:MAG: hypothetical protein A2723_02370 [Candidatus Zambryskibacteria bacterium RIFCSPHIGHO2_01_FULL_52_18]OHA96366.1 MAG: hypothetical protein A3D49_00530 [Candidatus Zambryskibacteria bacterium RIFCSPHIGHO2_02_FULL_43_37]OHB07767.1 MAG: hypothetical protein A2944_00395 [Candidatus Zambryskibacteria bacterium RIFCSPLOWO2_01_FULL_52_12]OHB11375.1 MAG: hypothetical protein A3J09_02375 [Candidatus Zambryskibacteria bacterium RIFCSPLOWO2_02_FULL_51_21]